MTTEQYVALIGDLVGSRDLPDRSAVQRTLEASLGVLNGRYGPGMAARMVITAGDEFQGLFRDPGDAARTAFVLREELWPVRIRFGLGRGTLTTPLRELAIGMDGSCFHAAREALETLRGEDEGGLVVRGYEPATEMAVNTVALLMTGLAARWTDRQAAFVRAMRNAPSQRSVAEAFDVSPSVVSESLQAAQHDKVRAGESAIGALLRGRSR